MNGKESQFIFNDGRIKGRLVKKDVDWYVGEWKYVEDFDAQGNPQTTGGLTEKDGEPKNVWFPWIAGKAEYLGLTEQDRIWAKS